MLRSILFTVMFTLAALSHAEESFYNRVDFQTEASIEVSNDLLTAQMNIEVSDPSPTRVAQRLNDTLNHALNKAANFPTVKSRSGNHNTYPIYSKDNHLDGWRGKAQLVLESRDFKAAGELIGILQQHMQLGGVQFSIASETRKALEESLVKDALAAFQKRAEVIRATLSGSAYKIVHININHRGNRPQPLMGRQIMAMSSEVSAPEFAGGDSNLTVQVAGTIEIVPE